MIPFPKVNIPTKTAQYHIVDQFLSTPYWSEENKTLFTADVTAEYPYAPPGFLQQMNTFELCRRKNRPFPCILQSIV